MYKLRVNDLDKKKVFVGVLALLLIIILIFVGLPKNCKTDEECFDLKAAKCGRVKVTLLKDDNQFAYSVIGKRGEDCVVKITMEKVSERQSEGLKVALQGKSMNCAIPRSLIQEKGINRIENIYDYCTGPLKEAFLDVTLQKMYDLVIRNIGTLTSGLQQVLNQSDKI